MDNTNQIEKVGTGLVASLETFKGAKIELAHRSSGFNGLSVYKDGRTRKIEVKTMMQSDKWIAINGIRAIDKLFFDRDYWIYFALYPENVVLATRALTFIQTQLGMSNSLEELNDLEQWMYLTKRLTKNNKFKFTPKINVTFPIPIRKLYNDFDTHKDKFCNSVIEIWKNDDGWKEIYKSDKYEEI
ncbi:MAG: hypothetical protein LBO69_06375 [Ignavibacteria bacterium]|jgi:hypothetical protein|nr:hypothetical protein [Ignavibacteria bacterium]